MEIIDSPTAPIAKTQSAPRPEPVKTHEVTLNADLLIPKFWNVVQAVLKDQITKGQLIPFEMGIYGCSKSQHSGLKAALDKAFSDFGTKNL